MAEVAGERGAVDRFRRLPVTIERASSRASATVGALLLAPVVTVMVAPASLLLASAAPVLPSALDNPMAAAQVTVGIAMWTGLFIVPVWRLLQRFGGRLSVHIEGGMVTVRERALARSSTRQMPLSAFAGIAHHVRSTLSGVRHELYLVHPKRGQSLLIHSADTISAATIDGLGALLGLPTIPAAGLYRFGVRAAAVPAAALVPPLAA
jgi:hypothetical protein